MTLSYLSKFTLTLHPIESNLNGQCRPGSFPLSSYQVFRNHVRLRSSLGQVLFEASLGKYAHFEPRFRFSHCLDLLLYNHLQPLLIDVYFETGFHYCGSAGSSCCSCTAEPSQLIECRHCWKWNAVTVQFILIWAILLSLITLLLSLTQVGVLESIFVVTCFHTHTSE